MLKIEEAEAEIFSQTPKTLHYTITFHNLSNQFPIIFCYTFTVWLTCLLIQVLY